mmetsp:Transcript_15493/g.40008  ORF Transcript_15493/g.40008 Transcript_15493/m.40008 type:complete len:147 (+) Transcript_15493:95-535(+)
MGRLLLVSIVGAAAAINKTVISTDDAPAAIGPYSQGIMITMASGEHMVHAAGQVGVDPSTGILVPGGIKAESKQVMENIKAIMGKAGAGMSDILECTCLMADLNEYSDFNSVYAEYFDNAPPARAAVEVSALPLSARVEVKCSAAF